MAFIELPPSFLCTGSRPAPPSSLPSMARPLPPKWQSSAGGAARGCAWRKAPRIAGVAVNLLDGCGGIHDGHECIHDGLMVSLKRMMLQDVIGYYSGLYSSQYYTDETLKREIFYQFLLQKKNRKEGLRVGQSLHRGCLWQLFCGTEREAVGHRLLPDIVTWQCFLAFTCVSFNQSRLVESILSCWWQFLIVQVRCHWVFHGIM